MAGVTNRRTGAYVEVVEAIAENEVHEQPPSWLLTSTRSVVGDGRRALLSHEKTHHVMAFSATFNYTPPGSSLRYPIKYRLDLFHVAGVAGAKHGDLLVLARIEKHMSEREVVYTYVWTRMPIRDMIGAIVLRGQIFPYSADAETDVRRAHDLYALVSDEVLELFVKTLEQFKRIYEDPRQ